MFIVASHITTKKSGDNNPTVHRLKKISMKCGMSMTWNIVYR